MTPLRLSAVALSCVAVCNASFLMPAVSHAQQTKAKSASTASNVSGKAYMTSGANTGGSLFLGDQAPGNQNGQNTVAGISAGGSLSAGSTGLGGQKNVIIGDGAGQNMTTGRESVIIGSGACNSLTGRDAGAEDGIVTCIGSIAAAHLTSQVLSSAFIGQKTGLDLEQSYYDVLLGNHTGLHIANSTRSTMIGQFAGSGDSLGSANGKDVTYNSTDNTVIGGEAAEWPSNNADKSQNTIVGAVAMQRWGAAVGNSVFGYNAGLGITDGKYNTCFGWSCMFGQTNGRWIDINGSYNSGFGPYSLTSITTGSRNIGVGYHTGDDLTTGSDNLLLGSYVGNRVGSGNANILIGGGAGNKYNYSDVVSIGYGSCVNPDDGMVCIGKYAGSSNNGTGNLFIGRHAGTNVTTGNNNLMIGQDAGVYTSGNDSGNTIIGNSAQISTGCSNTVQIGTGTNTQCGTVQLGSVQFTNANGQVVSKGSALLPSEILHITTDGSTTINRALANNADDAAVSFGARNALAAANMSGVFATNAAHGTLSITVPAVAGMQFDVTVTEVKN